MPFLLYLLGLGGVAALGYKAGKKKAERDRFLPPAQ